MSQTPWADSPIHDQIREAGLDTAEGSLADPPCYRLLDTDDIIRSDDEFLEDDAEHWSQIDWDHSWNIGRKWHSGLKPMRRIIQR